MLRIVSENSYTHLGGK